MRPGTQRSEPVWWRQIERRALRYKDPIERLRYLQNATREPPPAVAARRRRWPLAAPSAVLLGLLISTTTGGSGGSPAETRPLTAQTPLAAPAAPNSGRDSQVDDQVAAASPVWLVEASAEFELYSNGLRVDRTGIVSAALRQPKWAPRSAEAPAGSPPDPAGVVFHSSENDPAPFRPEHNQWLRRQGQGLLSWVRQRRLYHYVIDRFGQVHRILEDHQRAEHAGQSVWADADWVYVNLNDSFLGVCFEAQTGGAEQPELSEAQLRSGRALIEMLRSLYGLPVENCVTHAQVSVNASNHRIGYHTDWANGFPYRELGLPNNYRLPPPSLTLFGFEADSVFVKRAGPSLAEALRRAEDEIVRQAAAEGLSVNVYRRGLQERYRQALRQSAGMKERSS